MEARYAGRCRCHEEIEIGEPIRQDPETGEWCHEECAGTPKSKPTKFQGTSLEEMGF